MRLRRGITMINTRTFCAKIKSKTVYGYMKELHPFFSFSCDSPHPSFTLLLQFPLPVHHFHLFSLLLCSLTTHFPFTLWIQPLQSLIVSIVRYPRLLSCLSMLLRVFFCSPSNFRHLSSPPPYRYLLSYFLYSSGVRERFLQSVAACIFFYSPTQSV